MGLSAKLFFDMDKEAETLAARITLTDEQLEKAKKCKDKLLAYLKPELSNSLELNVKHWLQGSYKNATLIRPVRRGGEFDIDIGIYLLCNAEEDGLQAKDAKILQRDILDWFAQQNTEAKLEDSKNSCERLSYHPSFHIDIPLYYFDESTEACKLATQENGWVDSDPKALQDWFNNTVSNLNPSQVARLRRIIKYLKAWTALKWKGDERPIPSIALTVLVAQCYADASDDDDAFVDTSLKVLDYLLRNDTLESPINGDDLLGFDTNQLISAREKERTLLDACEFIKTAGDSLQQFVVWTGVFEHLFPPFSEKLSKLSGTTNLPAITTPPRIQVQHLGKSQEQLDNAITDSVRAYRGEHLIFSIANVADYPSDAEVHWTVRNQNIEAYSTNDLGHISNLPLKSECNEHCQYGGTHYMECLILGGGKILGISAVRVTIVGFSRPVRTPLRRKYF